MARACLCLLLAALLLPLVGAATPVADMAAPIRLQVDLRRAPERIIQVHEEVPVQPGRVTLRYPEWLPGKHAPDGPIANVAGLEIHAGGARLPWRRDLRDMYTIHVDVPAGITRLGLSFQYFAPRRHDSGEADPSTTYDLAVLEFNQVLFYPANRAVQQVPVHPSVTLPQGWRFASALQTRATRGTTVHFEPVSLSELVDSPVLCGRHLQSFDLDRQGTAPVRLTIASDAGADTQPDAEQLAALGRLGAQTLRLFGRVPYRHYDFLLALSDKLGFSTLGHRQSSDNRLSADLFTDEATFRLLVPMLAHEWLHSWNGNFRLPAALAADDYASARETDLLWLEEGLTDYQTAVLVTRAGLWTPEYFRALLAAVADLASQRSGRQWRSVQDTADAAQLAWQGSRGWNNWRRGADYHPEGVLLWLDVDATIRRLSENRRSLDDFARAFFGMPAADGAVKTYRFEDIVATLNAVQAHDWAAFLRQRLDYTGPDLPYHGLAKAGWKLAWGSEPGKRNADMRKLGFGVDLMASLGLAINDEGRIRDVAWQGPADAAGLVPGMQLVAVNGREFSRQVLLDGITAAQGEAPDVRLLTRDGDRYRHHQIDYHDGLRFPRLQRLKGTTDLLADILKPLEQEPVQ